MYAVFLVLFALSAGGGAAEEALPVSFSAAPAHDAQPQPPLATTGWASWYGWQFHGRPTASGEDYDMFALTAAHQSLPFHTVVRVSLVDGGSCVEVRINDRGPFVDDRIIDLSLGAARELGMLRSGVAQVRLQVLRLPPPLRYTLQIGSFRVPDNAHSLLHRLQGRDIPATLEPFGQLIRVVTEAATEAELPTIEQRLRAAGIGAWVRRVCTEPQADGAATYARRACPGGV